MAKAMRYHVFRYTKYYHRMSGAEIVQDMLNDPAVREVLQVCEHVVWGPISWLRIKNLKYIH